MPEPFELTNDPEPHPRQDFHDNDGRQKVLFGGTDCLPGQQDLFSTDGEPMIPDPIERGEDRCERWAAENVKGNQFTCCCGSVCDLDDGETVSADPYAIPVCPECFGKWFDEASK